MIVGDRVHDHLDHANTRTRGTIGFEAAAFSCTLIRLSLASVVV